MFNHPIKSSRKLIEVALPLDAINVRGLIRGGHGLLSKMSINHA